jgi:hypothetical protein
MDLKAATLLGLVLFIIRQSDRNSEGLSWLSVAACTRVYSLYWQAKLQQRLFLTS